MKLFDHAQQLKNAALENETVNACISRMGRKRPKNSSSRRFATNQEGNQRMVSFSSAVTCIEINHIDNSQWLSEKEMRDIKDRATKQARQMTSTSKNREQEVVDDTDEQCFRGLENRTAKGFRNKRRHKDTVVAAVMLQQDIYRDSPGGGNPGRVAFASMRNSLVCRKEALERAKLDELSVREYLATER